MSSRMTQVLLALSLLLNTFVLAGFIYRSWIEPPAFEHRLPPPPGPGPRPSPLEMVTHDLDLDDKQREALRSVIDRYAATRRERLREIQKLREQISGEYRHPTADLARVDAMIDQLTKLRADQQKETFRSLADLEPFLKPAQRERMHQVLAERLAGPPFQRPPGAGPGHGPGPGPGPGGRPPQ
jgi:Spy/CpxP family protein refolding chaperone